MEDYCLRSIYILKTVTKKGPLTGLKLSGLKNAVTLKMKSEAGGADAGEVQLLRMTEEERQICRESMKTKAHVQTASEEMVAKVAKTATREDLYASLTKRGVADNTAYEVDGVRFSSEEMTSIREVLSDVFASVKSPGSNLVYSDYAKMGIAENVTRSYAEKNLSEEQTEVIMKAVSEHMDQVIDKEVKAEIVDENLYYGKRITGEEFDRLFRKLYEASKEIFANSDLYSEEKKKRHSEYIDRCLETHTSGGILMSASNTELANSLRSGFANLNFEDEDELQTFFKQYQDWMRPAYLEIHGGSAEFAAEHLAEDIALYKKQYKDLTARVLAASMTHVDLQI